MSQRKIILMGSGRSGSNRLLDLFDRSPQTICRSEVNGIHGGEMGFLPGRRFFDEMTETASARVRDGAARAARRRSGRDRLDRPKDFLTPLARPWMALSSRHSLRVAARRLGLMDNPFEWQVPGFCLREEALKTAVLVFKLNGYQPWLDPLRADGQPLHLVHNIRNPRDFLASWYNRWMPRSDRATFAKAFSDIPPILAHFGRDPETADRLSDLSEQALLEIELWRWRFLNERLYVDLGERPDYHMVTYHAVDTDPVGTTRALFDFAGLAVTPEIEQAVAALENRLFADSHTRRLDPALATALIDDVLDSSPLRAVPGLMEPQTGL